MFASIFLSTLDYYCAQCQTLQNHGMPWPTDDSTLFMDIGLEMFPLINMCMLNRCAFPLSDPSLYSDPAAHFVKKSCTKKGFDHFVTLMRWLVVHPST